ncbi:hypothetical protein EBB56_09365 [Halomonas sp. YLB-10]|uniref:hypothetical protein n=1 Tax=Halomonas sp. YLB-10 TaxID=2483111 RepID=UPI000F5DB0FC|nr:hypothetical protein [Halomonas sp. YLB-10]RQW71359.1 hypothetical protein EBB56_09365 [Halomonas sp. YLB-10]
MSPNNIQALINTSVTDAKISMEGGIENDPAYAAHTATELLRAIQGKEGQASRRKMAAAVARKAIKELEKEPLA